MKRAFSLALAALLLAGCTAAPAASSDAAASAEPAPSPAAAESTEAAEAPAATGEALRPLLCGDKAQYYMTESVSEGRMRYVVADLANHTTGVPCDIEGCTHDNENCPATFTSGECGTAFVLDEDTLVAFTNDLTSTSCEGSITLMDRNCQNRRVLTASPETAFFVMKDDYPPYTDGQYLYCFGYHGDLSGTPALFRIDIATGAMTDLMADAPLPTAMFVGTLEHSFVFTDSDLAYAESTGDPAADAKNLPTGTITHSLLDIDTGEVRELYTYTSDEWNLASLDAYVVDGQYYQIDRAAGTLRTLDPATGESRQITDQLPAADPNIATTDYDITANVNGWLVFSGLPVIVNTDTGEVRQRAELPENHWNGSGQQPRIYLNLGDTLLVDCRWEPYTGTNIGPDGTPFTANSCHIYLGLISADDYLNGVPNYTEVGEYTA